MALMDFLGENIWVMRDRGIAIALEWVVELEGSQRRRWVVRMRRPDLKEGKLGSSSDSRSTAESSWHSTSLGRSTGRPLLVIDAEGKKLLTVAIEVSILCSSLCFYCVIR